MTFLVFSVFPAPDSPLREEVEVVREGENRKIKVGKGTYVMRTLCDSRPSRMLTQARSAMAKM